MYLVRLNLWAYACQRETYKNYLLHGVSGSGHFPWGMRYVDALFEK